MHAEYNMCGYIYVNYTVYILWCMYCTARHTLQNGCILRKTIEQKNLNSTIAAKWVDKHFSRNVFKN